MHDENNLFAPAGQGTIELKVSSEQSGGALSMFLQTLPVGTATFTHIHRNCEETIYAIAGALRVTVGDRSTQLGPGHSSVVPRNIRHAISNDGPGEAQFLFIVTPGGIEGFFRKANTGKIDDPQAEAARINALAEEYGVEIVAPPSP